MSDDNELDPRIVSAMRAVPPASDSLREQHIAAALAEISPVSARRPFNTWLSAAAAVVVLLVGGNALYGSLSSSDRTPGEVAIRSGVATTTIPVKASAACRPSGDSGRVGNYELNDQKREVWASNGTLFVYASDTCEELATLDIADAPPSDVVCTPSLVDATDSIIGGYTMGGAYRVLVNTSTHIVEYSGKSCSLLTKYPQP
ncbi:unannotated protein [freshwater metagenome]|uniref:Unannotated protein n=1 Tax=freshwater metagenome TaxID=449393 RepID=A0A6J6HHV7_9ZZZZ|nr:hypothetical protein [Actinomycetota bacterium]